MCKGISDARSIPETPDIPVALRAGFAQALAGCTQVNGSRLISQAPWSTAPVAVAEPKEHEAELIPTVQRLLAPAALSGDAKSLGMFFLDWPKWTSSWPGTDQ